MLQCSFAHAETAWLYPWIRSQVEHTLWGRFATSGCECHREFSQLQQVPSEVTWPRTLPETNKETYAVHAQVKPLLRLQPACLFVNGAGDEGRSGYGLASIAPRMRSLDIRVTTIAVRSSATYLTYVSAMI